MPTILSIYQLIDISDLLKVKMRRDVRLIFERVTIFVFFRSHKTYLDFFTHFLRNVLTQFETRPHFQDVSPKILLKK